MQKLTTTLSFLLFSLLVFTAKGQPLITGRVTDLLSGEPLAGANVACLGFDQGTVTDAEGAFSLSCPGDSLRVSFTGYRPRIVTNLATGEERLIQLTPGLPAVEEEIVVSAPPIPVQLSIPAPLNRLYPGDFRRDDGLAVTPALNRLSGLLMHTGALNTNRITIRGIGNRSPFGTAKIRAYLDDIPLTNGVGETTIEDIDLSLIQNIDVWKGPTASTYGAGLGGMIHLRTAELEDAAPSFAQWHSTLGAYDRRRLVGQVHYRQADRLTWDLNVNQTHSDGYRDNNNYDRLGVAAIGKLRSGERHQTSLLINYTDLRAEIPSSLNREDFENNPQQAAANWARVSGFEDNQKLVLGLSHQADLWEGRNGRQLRNTTSFFTSHRDNYEVRPFNILRENSFTLGLRSRFDFRRYAGASLPLFSLGVEAFRERYDWQTNAVTATGGLDSLLSDNLEYRRFLNLFAEANLPLHERWRLILGINLNRTGYDLTDRFPGGPDQSGDYTYDPVWSPRLGLNYDLSERMALFATISHGFSLPSLEETLTPEGARNPDIQPETGWNAELGWRGDHLWDRLSFELSVYSMRIDNLLVARRTALDQYVGTNAGKTVHNGLEVFLNWQPLPVPDMLSIWTSYTFADYRFEEFVDRESDFSGNDLTGTTPHLFNAGIDFAWGGLYGNMNVRHVAAMPVNDANTVYSDAYQVAGLRVGYQTTTFLEKLLFDVYAGVNNLFDEKYAAMLQVNAVGFGGSAPRYYYPGLPRNSYLGVRLRYQWTE